MASPPGRAFDPSPHLTRQFDGFKRDTIWANYPASGHIYESSAAQQALDGGAALARHNMSSSRVSRVCAIPLLGRAASSTHYTVANAHSGALTTSAAASDRSQSSDLLSTALVSFAIDCISTAGYRVRIFVTHSASIFGSSRRDTVLPVAARWHSFGALDTLEAVFWYSWFACILLMVILFTETRGVAPMYTWESEPVCTLFKALPRRRHQHVISSRYTPSLQPRPIWGQICLLNSSAREYKQRAPVVAPPGSPSPPEAFTATTYLLFACMLAAYLCRRAFGSFATFANQLQYLTTCAMLKIMMVLLLCVNTVNLSSAGVLSVHLLGLVTVSQVLLHLTLFTLPIPMGWLVIISVIIPTAITVGIAQMAILPLVLGAIVIRFVSSLRFGGWRLLFTSPCTFIALLFDHRALLHAAAWRVGLQAMDECECEDPDDAAHMEAALASSVSITDLPNDILLRISELCFTAGAIAAPLHNSGFCTCLDWPGDDLRPRNGYHSCKWHGTKSMHAFAEAVGRTFYQFITYTRNTLPINLAFLESDHRCACMALECLRWARHPVTKFSSWASFLNQGQVLHTAVAAQLLCQDCRHMLELESDDRFGSATITSMLQCPHCQALALALHGVADIHGHFESQCEDCDEDTGSDGDDETAVLTPDLAQEELPPVYPGRVMLRLCVEWPFLTMLRAIVLRLLRSILVCLAGMWRDIVWFAGVTRLAVALRLRRAPFFRMFVINTILAYLPLAASTDDSSSSSRPPPFGGERTQWTAWLIAFGAWVAWRLTDCATLLDEPPEGVPARVAPLHGVRPVVNQVDIAAAAAEATPRVVAPIYGVAPVLNQEAVDAAEAAILN